MLRFDDLTGFSVEERVSFDLELDWCMSYFYKDSGFAPYFYRIKPEASKIIDDASCKKSIHTRFGCTLYRNHKGPCICWHPEQGLLASGLVADEEQDY